MRSDRIVPALLALGVIVLALAGLASTVDNRPIIGGKCAVTHAFLCY